MCEWLDVEYNTRDSRRCLRLPPVTVRDVHRISTLVAWRILCFLLLKDETNNMHALFAIADRISGEVIGAAIEVRRIIGPGLLESIYERCFHESKLVDGISRLVLPGANKSRTEGNEGNQG